MKTTKTPRAVTPQEIADIVTETVNETEKGLNYLKNIISMVAELTVKVCQALERDPDVEIEQAQSRGLKENAQVWKCVVKLKEG